jgi:hypothetical protein
MATAPEVLAIAAHLSDKFTEEEQARVMEAIDVNIAATEGKGYEERHDTTVACPLLKDGICTVYEVRPLACARWHSFDVEQCRVGYEQPHARTTVRVNASAMAAGIAIQDGYQTALKADRVDHRGLDLVRGLKIALEETPQPRPRPQWPTAADQANYEGMLAVAREWADAGDAQKAAHYIRLAEGHMAALKAIETANDEIVKQRDMANRLRRAKQIVDEEMRHEQHP